VDVFAMPQSGTGVSVEAVDHAFQTNMLDMLKQTGRYALPHDLPLLILVFCRSLFSAVDIRTSTNVGRDPLVAVRSVLHPCQVNQFPNLILFKSYITMRPYAILMSAKCSHPSCCERLTLFTELRKYQTLASTMLKI
jgi:hypothetical protein